LDIDTKRRIDTARDILVGKLPDPKSQVEQITIALIYKFMDDMDKQSEELGGKAKFFTGEFEKYSWSKIFDPRVSGFDLVNLYSEAIQRMNHNPNIPPLFRDIFKNAYLPYRDPETLKMFLKVIGEFNYDHSERLGDAYEQLLSIMGSQGDAGQFRTPRHIIDFMVEVTDPKKNETILDPACGTAGFLIFSYNHILNKNRVDSYVNLSPEERAKLVENIVGYDISPDMVRIALVNMYLHGFQNPKIYEYDTLASEDRWNEYYDIMLANPPFMSPRGGVRPHKRFSIQSKRSEVLFVDYIAEHLSPHGRGAVIVPEGIIFKSDVAYKKLRKSLIENSLYAVVSLPAGVFNPYSGVKTSILFLNKNLAKKTDNILFVKTNNDGYGLGAQRREIKENDLPLSLEIIQKYQQSINENTEFELNTNEAKLSHLVQKEKIAESGDYNLSGDRYKETIVYSGKWDFVQLGEVTDILGGYAFKSNELKNEKLTNEHLPIIKIGNLTKEGKLDLNSIQYYKYENYLSKYLIFKSDVLVAMTGATVGKVSVSNQDNLLLNQRVGRIRGIKSRVSKEYLKFFLLSDLFYNYCQKIAGGGAQGNISPSKILSFKIPLPPLEIQEQIVAELESYQKIIDGARQVVENYKPTFKIDPDWEWVEIGEISNKLEYGYSESAKDNGDYRYIRITDISENGLLKDDEIKYVNLNEKSKNYILKKGDILVARTGATYGKTLYFDREIKAIFAGYLIRINFNKEIINPSYFWAFSQSIEYLKQKHQLVQGGGQPQFNANAIKKIKVPVPPVEAQKEIILKIENEQKIIDANKELIKIYEQKIKEKIAEVWGE
jgi:type I restriction enzyme M protein